MIFFFTASCVSILGTDVTDIFRSFWHFVRNWTINLKKKMHSKKIINCIEKSICSRKRSQNDVKKCYLKRKKTAWNAVNKEKHFIYLHLVSMQTSDVDFWSYVLSPSHDRTVLCVMKAEDAQWKCHNSKFTACLYRMWITYSLSDGSSPLVPSLRTKNDTFIMQVTTF